MFKVKPTLRKKRLKRIHLRSLEGFNLHQIRRMGEKDLYLVNLLADELESIPRDTIERPLRSLLAQVVYRTDLGKAEPDRDRGET